MRLDAYLRENGVASRDETRKLVSEHRITINGCTAEHAAMDCAPTDDIRIDGGPVSKRQPLYLMLHKPAGCISATASDTEQTVLDLLPEGYRNRAVFPVGRLDKASEGLLLLTNDGDFCRRVIEPEQHIPKTYYIRVGRPFPETAETDFQQGILFPNGTLCRPAEIEISADRREALVTVTEGKTHQVRRMAAACGVRVQYLKRVSIGALQLDEDLSPGQCRLLTEREIALIFQTQ